MRARKKEKSKSLGLAIYFGFFVFLIIVISFLFKSIDTIRKSRFDGNNRFTVALFLKEKTDIVSISPKEGTLKKLRIASVTTPKGVRTLSIPVDSHVNYDSEFSYSTKLYFLKMLLNKRNFKTDLSTFDLLKLSIYSLKISDENIKEESLPTDENSQKVLLSNLFIDEAIASEKLKIQITNATKVSGLGNKIARYLSSMGANVVLVNSSKDTLEKSKIIYTKESYTLKKISQVLKVPNEKGNTSYISDILLIVGEDLGEF